MIAKRHYRWLYAASVVLVVGLITLAGCDGSGYKTFILRKGIGHFYFEYPSIYKVAKVETRTDLKYIHMNLTGSLLKNERAIMKYCS